MAEDPKGEPTGAAAARLVLYGTQQRPCDARPARPVGDGEALDLADVRVTGEGEGRARRTYPTTVPPSSATRWSWGP